MSSLLAQADSINIRPEDLGFAIPTFTDLLTFLIRLFFILAGLAALFMLLTGALAWIVSGGNKENLEKARDRMTHALVGLLIMVGVLSVMWSLENVLFSKALCFGITCSIKIPTLIK